MSGGIKDLLDVRVLLDRIAEQDRLIEELLETNDQWAEVKVRLVEALEATSASDERSNALFEEALRMVEEVEDQREQAVKNYQEIRDAQLAGTKSRQERAAALYPESLAIYREERARGYEKEVARDNTQARLAKKYPEHRHREDKNKIWKDSHFKKLIAKLEKDK